MTSIRSAGALALVAGLLTSCQSGRDQSEPTHVGPRIRVLLVGTFDFDQVEPEGDMLTAKRQSELTAVIDKLSAFGPDKIFLERNPAFEFSHHVAASYADYLAGDFELPVSEVYQLGFRIAARAGLERIHLADAPGRWGALYSKAAAFAEATGQTRLLAGDALATVSPNARSAESERLQREATTIARLRYLNSAESRATVQGYYVSALPRVGDTEHEYGPGVDAEMYFVGAELLGEWYRRNVRIYANVLTQLDYEEQRILILYSANHQSTLLHLFESNPFFHVEHALDWLE